MDLDVLFSSIHQRLRNPEWEVRQHALRVLSDFIPLIDSTILDLKMESLLGDLITNLGHIGPAVRKAAVDSLKIYLLHSKNADYILRNLAEKGVEHANENKIQTNIVLGIILALPFLLSYKTHDEIIFYLINILLDKLVQITNQETIMTALFRIRELIGGKKFDKELIIHGEKTKKEFEMLCDIYNLHSLNDASEGLLEKERKMQLHAKAKDVKTNTLNIYSKPIQDNKTGNVNKEVQTKDDVKLDSETVETNGEKDSSADDKVILETEIKLRSGSAITMKIHEESRQNSFNDTTDSEDDGR